MRQDRRTVDREFRDGENLYKDIPEEVSEQIDALMTAISNDQVECPDQLETVVPKPWTMLKYITRPSNFAKHADKDPNESLEEENLNPRMQ